MRCLLIEYAPESARYVCTALEEPGAAAMQGIDGREGLDVAINEAWDFIIVTGQLASGGVDGVSIVRQLRDLGRKTPVLFLSSLNVIDGRVDDAMHLPLSELLARVGSLLRGTAITRDPVLLQVADLRLDTVKFQVTRGATRIALQPRELQLLAYLMRHQNQVVTRDMLLAALWDRQFDPETNVIDVQISRLRRKVDRGFTPPLIHTLRGVGYLLGTRGLGMVDESARQAASGR